MKKKSKIYRITLIAVCLFMAVTVFAGCNTTKEDPAVPTETENVVTEPVATEEESGAPEETSTEPLKIGVSIDAGFQARMVEVSAIHTQAVELGFEVIEQNADGDATKQTQQVKSMVDQGCNAIVICAVDNNSINTAIDYAVSKDVIVTTFDRFLEHPDVAFATGYESIEDGRLCGEWIKSLDDGKDHVIFELVGSLADVNAIERRDGFHEVIDPLTNIKVIQINTEWDPEQALTGLQNALQKYPDVWAIYSPSSHMDESVKTALAEANRLAKVGEEGHVHFITLNASEPGYSIAVEGYTDMVLVNPLEKMCDPILDQIIKINNGEQIAEARAYLKSFMLAGSEVEANKDRIWSYVYRDLA